MQLRLAAARSSNRSMDGGSSAAQRLLQLSQQYTLAPGDGCQLTAEEWMAHNQMLLQQGVRAETLQKLIEQHNGRPYMLSASKGTAVLAVRGFSVDAMNSLKQSNPNIIQRPGSAFSDVFAALVSMLHLSRTDEVRMCLKQASLLHCTTVSLEQRWACEQAHYRFSTNLS